MEGEASFMTKHIPDGQIAAPECICRKMGRPGAPIVACEVCGRTQPVTPPERTADGTKPGREKLIGQRVAVSYPYEHRDRHGKVTTTEQRHGFGRVVSLSMSADGFVRVRLDREPVETVDVEVSRVEVVA